MCVSDVSVCVRDVCVKLRVFCQCTAVLSSLHAVNAQQYERNAEELPHVEKHAVLEVYLILFCVLDEDAAGEDEEQAQSKEETTAHTNTGGGRYGCDLICPHGTTVEEPSHEEEARIAECLIELSGMAWQQVYTLEDECPWEVRGSADDFRVHEISNADGAGTDGSDDGNIVQYPHDIESLAFGIQPQYYHQSYGTSVAGKSLETGVFPTAVSQLSERQDDF